MSKWENSLKAALEELAVESMLDIPSEKDINEPYFDSISRKKLKKDAEHIWRRARYGSVVRLRKIAIAAALIVIIGGTFLLITPVRAAFLDFYIFITGNELVVRFNSENVESTKFIPFVPSWLPEGVDVQSYSESDQLLYVLYADDDSEIYFKAVNNSEGSMESIYNYGDYNYSEETVGEYDCTLFTSDFGESEILMEKDEIVYELASVEYDLETLKEIIENLTEPEVLEVPQVSFSYLPEGYSVYNEVRGTDFRSIAVRNEEAEQLRIQVTKIKDGYIDPLKDAGTAYETEEIAGNACLIIEKSRTMNAMISWEKGGYAWFIEADTLDASELKAVVEGIDFFIGGCDNV